MHARPLWQPSAERIARSQMMAFIDEVNARHDHALADYAALYRWSIENPELFWSAVWDFCEILASARGTRILVDKDKMPGAKWFPEARLNFAENLLRQRGGGDAIVFWGEDKVKRRLSHDGLHRAVAALAAALRAAGVRAGDRIAAYLPNMPEAVIAALACASIGAIYSSSSPDFGAQGVLDRFGQIEPKILFAVDGYYYRGQTTDCLQKVRAIVDRLPSVQQTVIVPYVNRGHDLSGIRTARMYADLVSPHAHETEIRFEQLPFDYPLYIMYSSGTTGVPKCIVHAAGGVLLQHAKEHRLHGDLQPGDRLFYFATCGWMMWNWLVSGLAAGATLLLYDGSPFLKNRGGAILFDYADAERITHFGTSAKFIDAIAKEGLAPIETHRLEPLRTIFSTGSPLAPESFDYVYRSVKHDVCLASISGGTDLLSCFVLGNPLLPVWRGEIQCRGLGMKVEVYDERGHSLHGQKGELVCTAPFPTMPIRFWDDPDGSKYHRAYFEKFPNVWCHGDYAEITEHDGVVIYGRSDAVLNPGGVRIGTAEIYRQVEKLAEVVEALAIGQQWPPNSADLRIVLFVRLREGMTLDDALAEKIKRAIRDNATPRHVPAKIVQVPDIPRTRSGKIVELAVRNVVHGEPVKNIEALANPEALAHFRDRPELRT